MLEYSDLEITLQRESASSYNAEFRLSLLSSDADQRQTTLVSLDLQALSLMDSTPAAYGRALAEQLLGDPQARAAFAAARAGAQGSPLRLRLSIASNASELHGLFWETLCDPQDGTLLFTGENLVFSRYLSSRDWQPVHLRSKGELKALVVISNPSDLDDYQLAPVDVEGEAGRIRQALQGIPVEILPSNGRRASLAELVKTLRDGGYDLLYLVTHGVLAQNQPWLFLENDEGKVARASGTDLASCLQELGQRPRLIVLASCQSAADRGAGVQAALGPRLAEAGIPAVVAMQGNISLKTLAEFMQVFFSELQKDGLIDRAMSIARGAVRSQPDFWMPALFMRLKSGRIWYVPTFYVSGGGGDREDFDQWESLTSFIQLGQCTPILGPVLIEPLLGSRRDIARQWAEKHGYPLSADDQDDLPRVSQYLLTRYNPAYLQLAYNQSLRDGLVKRFGSAFPPEWIKARTWTPDILSKALELAADELGEGGPNPIYKRLAELPLSIYLTANPGDLLEHALQQAGKDPQVRLCPWNQELTSDARDWWQYENIPTPEAPLVYHIFGHFKVPTSLVLTEDDYLDSLIGLTANKDLVPSFIRAALASSALLFLGFQIDDWNFRIFFRSLMAQEGKGQRLYLNHLAAQIEPDENLIQNPDRARRFLEKYFESGKIGVYWGSASEFLDALSRHL